MRNAFIKELIALAHQRDNIALIVGDLGYSVVEPFAEAFPDRFFNAGVAEQNMTGLAAGMASEGYHVFTYSIANFPTFRCAEQIRNDVDYHNLPVTVVAVGGGLAYGALGYSHHAVQDYALIRCMPNMLIAAPGDPMETRACLRYLVEHPQPSYLRLGKAGETCRHDSVPEVEPGKWLSVKNSTTDKKTFLATGAALSEAFAWTEQASHANHGIHSMPLWSMASKKFQPEQIVNFNEVLTIEDHLYDGGFGSWLLESAIHNPALMPRIKNMALSSTVCGSVGSQSTLNHLGGISP